ncbi:hypothetical protein ACVR1G_09630 [Streptococcus dentasini]
MMNEKEWAEFFELVNGRKPEAADYVKAEAAGEYIPDQPKQAGQTVDTPAEQPTQIEPESSELQPESSQVQENQQQEQPPQLTDQAPVNNMTVSQNSNTAVLNSFGQPVMPAPQKPKRFPNLFYKEGQKGWPIWLNIGIMVIIAVLLLTLGILGFRGQEKAAQKNIEGDWELVETAYYDDGGWDTFSQNSRIVDSKYKEDTKGLKINTFLSSKNGNLVSYNYITFPPALQDELPDDVYATASLADPALTLNVKTKEHRIETRIEDSKFYNYYLADPDEPLQLDDWKAKYFINDNQLTIVYFEHGEPYFKETYKSMTKQEAKKAKNKAKNGYEAYHDLLDEYYGDDEEYSDDSDYRGGGEFQAG